MNGVKDTLVKLQERFPDGVSYVVSYDPTQYISATMAEIVETLIIALILWMASRTCSSRTGAPPSFGASPFPSP